MFLLKACFFGELRGNLRAVYESTMILKLPFRLHCVTFLSITENCDVSRVCALKYCRLCDCNG